VPKTLLAALLALSCLLVAAPVAASAKAGAPGATTSVIDGTEARPGQYPFMAFIAELQHGTLCSGTVVAPRVVLTAAHCVMDLGTGARYGPEGFRVLTGALNLLGEEGEVSEVTRVASYPTFTLGAPGYGFGDAALLQLAAPVAAPPVPLATGAQSKSLIHTGTRALVAGWGLTQPENKDPSETLLWTRMVIEGKRCEGLRGRICAIDFPRSASGTCHGDSGGPMLVRVGAKKRLVELAIVHAGFGACSPRRPGLFTRIDMLGKWIHSQIRALQ